MGVVRSRYSSHGRRSRRGSYLLGWVLWLLSGDTLMEQEVLFLLSLIRKSFSIKATSRLAVVRFDLICS